MFKQSSFADISTAWMYFAEDDPDRNRTLVEGKRQVSPFFFGTVAEYPAWLKLRETDRLQCRIESILFFRKQRKTSVAKEFLELESQELEQSRCRLAQLKGTK